MRVAAEGQTVVALVAVGYVVATAAVGWGLGGEDTAVAVADLSALVAALIALAAVWRARRSTPDRGRWTLLAAALACWALGEALWTTWEVVLGDEVPYPSVADIAYLAAVPFAVAGIVGFVPAGQGRFGARSILDACIVAGSTLVVGWDAALGPAIRATGEPVLTHAITIAYPLTDVVMAALAVVVLQWGRSSGRRPLALVAVGFLLMAIADTAFTWMISQGTYSGDALVTMLWPASYLAIAAGARAERGHRAEPRPNGAGGTFVLVLPYLPLIAAAAVVVAHLAGGRELGPFVGVLGAVLVVLVLLRQAVTAFDLHRTVRALAEREAELARLAMTDALTGLANRTRFGDCLEAALAANPIRPAVVYIDLDGFKTVNDRFGHGVGDRLLVAAAERLQACATPTMLVARLGGDEFVVLVEEGHSEAIALAHRILDAFTMPFDADGETIRFQASVGVASAPPDGSPEEAIRRADAAMYVAKTTGKGRAVDYPDDTILTV